MQIIAGLVLAVGFYVGVSPLHGRSAFYGGLISVLLSYLLSRGVRRAEAVAAANPRQSMTILYIGAAQRFFIAIAAFAVGLAYLNLEPLAMFIGFAVAQLAYVINAREPARKKKEA
jgi:ATP synthase protein I